MGHTTTLSRPEERAHRLHEGFCNYFERITGFRPDPWPEVTVDDIEDGAEFLGITPDEFVRQASL